MSELIKSIIFSGLLMLIGIISTMYGISRIPDDYGIMGKGCKDVKGAFIYNFFGMGGAYLGVFSGIYFIAMIFRLLIYMITNCKYMLIQ